MTEITKEQIEQWKALALNVQNALMEIDDPLNSTVSSNSNLYKNHARAFHKFMVETNMERTGAKFIISLCDLALRGLATQPRPIAEAPKDDTAWLVECFNGQRDQYLKGFDEHYMCMGFAYMPEFTADHLEALRFTRENDAAKQAAQLSPTSRAKAVEHSWMKQAAFKHYQRSVNRNDK